MITSSTVALLLIELFFRTGPYQTTGIPGLMTSMPPFDCQLVRFLGFAKKFDNFPGFYKQSHDDSTSEGPGDRTTKLQQTDSEGQLFAGKKTAKLNNAKKWNSYIFL
jgi:hypothetical protein